MPPKYNLKNRNEFNALPDVIKSNDLDALKVIVTEFMRQNSDYAFVPIRVANELGFKDTEVRPILIQLVKEGYLKTAPHAAGNYYIWRVFPYDSQNDSFKEI